jgi:hypothetical protein
MVATCGNNLNISVQCQNDIPGICTGNLNPCGCQIECAQVNLNEPPNCTWNCNQTDPICGGQPCLPPSPTPNCCYDNPSWCTTPKNCNPTKDPFPSWLIVLVLFIIFLLIFV